MRIAVIGRRDVTGTGVFYGAFCDQLKEIGFASSLIFEVDALNFASVEAARTTSVPGDVNIWFHAAPNIAAFSGTNIVWAVFEATVLPTAFLAQLEAAQVIWTPSAWGKSVLIANGVNAHRIDVVPEGVDPAAFNPHFRPRERGTRNAFHFLAIGKLELRKSYEELFVAFSRTFAGQADKRLIIKADYFARADNRTADMHALLSRFPEVRNQIRIVTGRLSLGEMARLYLAADAFVFPSKGEGWGLPLIEALAAGVPTISTIHSGHSYYLEGCRSQVSIIQHTLDDIDDADFKQIWHGAVSLGQWAVPSVDSIAAHMRAVYNDYALHHSLARQASDYVRRNFSWSNSAHVALNRLGDRGLLRPVLQID